MAHTIQRLEGEPIVVVTFSGSLGAKEPADFMPQGAQMQRESPVLLYWVIDVRATWSDFSQIIHLIGHQSRGTPGTASNAPGRVFLVGSAHMTRLYVEGMRQPQFGGFDIPMFPSLEDALDAARVIIRAQA